MRSFHSSHLPPLRADAPACPDAATLGFEALDVEIGCGVGLHPLRYARENPNRVLVAIEQTVEKFNKFARRVSRHERLPNLVPVHANAIGWISHRVRPASIDRVLLLYPNPNPKSLNQRWHAMPFMERLIACLKPCGEIWLATNMYAYAAEAHDYFERIWQLEVIEQRSYSIARPPEGGARTHFEKKYLERGEICYELRVRKPAQTSQ